MIFWINDHIDWDHLLVDMKKSECINVSTTSSNLRWKESKSESLNAYEILQNHDIGPVKKKNFFFKAEKYVMTL